MGFRQNELVHREGCILSAFLLPVLVIITAMDPQHSILWSVLALCCPAFSVLWSVLMRKRIVIDDRGITCQRSGSVIWQYQWSDIAQLKLGIRFHNPSVEIIPTPERSKQEPKVETPRPYFQLGPSAKKALKARGFAICRQKGIIQASDKEV